MTEILTAALVGAMAGGVGGLLPGINNSIILISLFFLLIKFDPIVICAFYIGCVTVSQYMGSVTATLTGAPGESSSLPALTEGYAMKNQGLGRLALKISALGSFTGSLIAILLGLSLWRVIDQVFVLSYTEVRLVFITSLFIMLVLFTRNTVMVNLLLIFSGFLLGRIGYNPYTSETWGDLGNVYLAGGLPKITVIVFFYAIPIILYYMMSISKNDESIKQKTSTKNTDMPWGAVIRGSITGFICGLIPNLTYVVSTKFAWIVEKFFVGNKYQVGNVRCLAAAETANNAAVLSSLIPLLVFAVPINLSEVILVDIIRMGGTSLTPGWITESMSWIYLLCAFFIANVIGITLAWPLGQQSVNFVVRWQQIVVPVIITVMTMGVFYDAWKLDQIWYYAVVSVLSLLVGWQLRKIDLIPFMFAFLLSRPVELVFTISLQKYFL